MNDKQLQQEPAPLFAVLELFGHQRIAGRISEQTFGGAALVRVDVPEIEVEERTSGYGEERKTVKRVIQAHTRSFGAGAIYSVNWCDEAAAQIAARSIKHEPLSPYSVKEAIDSLPDDQRQRLLAPPRGSTRSLIGEEEPDDIPY